MLFTISDIKTKFEITFQSIFQDYCKYILNIGRDKKWANFFNDNRYIELSNKIRYWQEKYGEALADFLVNKNLAVEREIDIIERNSEYEQELADYIDDFANKFQDPSNEAKMNFTLNYLKGLNIEKRKFIDQFQIPADVTLVDDAKWFCIQSSKDDAKNMYNMRVEGSVVSGGVFKPKTILVLNPKLNKDFLFKNIQGNGQEIIFTKANIPWLVADLLNINNFIAQTKNINLEVENDILNSVRSIHNNICNKLSLLDILHQEDAVKTILTKICSDFLWKSMETQIGIKTPHYIKITKNIEALDSVVTSYQNDNTVIILTGAAKIGKTSCAEEYVRENYTGNVIWKFQASDLENAFIEFASYIGVAYEIKNFNNYIKLGELVKKRLSYLAPHIKSGMVTIFDDAVQEDILSICLWSLSSTLRIITTRNANLVLKKFMINESDDEATNRSLKNYNQDIEKTLLKSLEISPFTNDDVAQYIAQRFAEPVRKKASYKEVTQLINTIGLFPNLIEMVVSYLVKHPTKKMIRYIKSFDSTQKMLIHFLESLDQETLKFVITLAKLDSECLEKEFLISKLFTQNIKDKLVKLVELAIIVPVETNSLCAGYKLPKKVQQIIKELFKTDQDQAIIKFLINVFEVTTDIEFQEYIHHVKKVIMHAENLDIDHNNLKNLYLKLANFYKSIKQHDTAVEYFEKVFLIDQDIVSKQDSINLASSYTGIAFQYNSLRVYNKALECHLKALEIKGKVLPKDHPDLASSYNNVGATYHYLNDKDNAIKYIKCAYKICSMSQYCDRSGYIKSINVLDPQCDSICLEQSICVVGKLQHDINDIGKEEL